MSSDSEDDYFSMKKRLKTTRTICPYTQSVNKFSLDFDFDKVCSVTLSNSNVYACLVCGKYFQGRGKETPAYLHSMDEEHHVFINLVNGTVWCLPDNYEVFDDSLEDIKFNLNPVFTKTDLEKLPSSSLSLTGAEYHPGLVGLNQVKDASYLNAVVHALCGVVPVRDYFVLLSTTDATPRLTKSFSDLLKKICNWQSFKGLTSPHEFLHQISLKSKGEFFASHADPFKLMEWLLPAIQSEIKDPIISRHFRGEYMNGDSFISLSLDLPHMPVFKGEKEFMPTAALSDLLTRKFASDKPSKLPPYLMLHFKRFVKNNFFLEKNSTLVRFPLTQMTIENCNYSLIACIAHDGKPEEGIFKSYVLHPVSNQWFECEGLRVRKTLPQSVALVESYVHIWRKD